MSAMGGKRSLGFAPAPSPDNQHRVEKRPSRDACEDGYEKHQYQGSDERRFDCNAKGQRGQPTDHERHSCDEQCDAKPAPYERNCGVQPHPGEFAERHPTRSPSQHRPDDKPHNNGNREHVPKQRARGVALHREKGRAAREQQSRDYDERPHKSGWSRSLHGDNIPPAANVRNGSKADPRLAAALGGNLPFHWRQ